jgi:hypothetical protein
MGKINKAWHQTHKLARNATLEQRIEWHIQHSAECGCRQPPPTIRAEMDRRGLLEATIRNLR